MAKPFESRIQDLVYNVEVGVGLRIIKAILYVFFVMAIMIMYAAIEFKGFSDAEAMEFAQLGRNLSRPATVKVVENGEEVTKKLPYKYYTKSVRPVDLWHQIKNTKKPEIVGHPETRRPPVYPAALATVFKIAKPEFKIPPGTGSFSGEKPVMVFGLICTLIGGLFTWLLARRLFDGRVGLLAMTLYYLSDSVWGHAVSGLPISMAMTTTVATFYFATLAVISSREGKGLFRTLIPVLITCVLCLVLFLTRYAAIAIVPGLMVVYIFGMARRGWVPALLVLLTVAVGSAPWFMRNKDVCGSYLGMAPYAALVETQAFPKDSLSRNLNPEEQFKDRDKVVKGVRAAAMARTGQGFAYLTDHFGDGFLPAFFLVTFFYGFVRPQVNVLRWGVALTLFFFLLIAAFFGTSVWELTALVWPVGIIYGCALFYILLDRANFEIKLLGVLMTSGMILLCALPLLFTLMPPRKDIPYPPYQPGLIYNISNLITDEELISTDMPWATAWYGDKLSIQTPSTLDDFYNINDYIKRISGLYITPITTDQPFVSGTLRGTNRTWYGLMQGRIPTEFPLKHGIPLMNHEQMFFSDRPRWQER